MESQRRATRAMLGVTWKAMLVVQPLGARLSGHLVAESLASGLVDGGLPWPDVQHAEREPVGAKPRRDPPDPAVVDRIKAARAVVIAAERLDERTLLGSVPFEVATTARQAGVPCYAVVRENEMALFDARLLDLQVVIAARSAAALRRAGRRLAEVI